MQEQKEGRHALHCPQDLAHLEFSTEPVVVALFAHRDELRNVRAADAALLDVEGGGNVPLEGKETLLATRIELSQLLGSEEFLHGEDVTVGTSNVDEPLSIQVVRLWGELSIESTRVRPESVERGHLRDVLSLPVDRLLGAQHLDGLAEVRVGCLGQRGER